MKLNPGSCDANDISSVSSSPQSKSWHHRTQARNPQFALQVEKHNIVRRQSYFLVDFFQLSTEVLQASTPPPWLRRERPSQFGPQMKGQSAQTLTQLQRTKQEG